MSNYIKDLHNIQKFLEKNGYSNSLRIAKDIEVFSKKDNFSIEKMLKRIANGEPWEYIKGEADFLGETFIVNKNVLIPRIETEELTLLAKGFLDDNKSYKHIIDVGTGSGCIIIFLAKIFCKKNNYKFIGIERSKKALEIAKKNSVLHNVNEKVTFQKGNLISETDINTDTLVVANLPYIPTRLYKKLDRSVKDFEPREALDGGNDGLKYYKELIKQIESKLKKGKNKYRATLLIEIDHRTTENIKDTLIDKEYLIKKDFRGLDRFVLIHFP